MTTTENITAEQMRARRDALRTLMADNDVRADAGYGDYEHEELYAIVGYVDDPAENEFPEEPLTDCGRYALIHSDETYTTITVSATLDEALQAVADVASGETLNVPGALLDLDTGRSFSYRLCAVLVEES